MPLNTLTTAPQYSGTTATATQQTLPTWYTQFIQDLASRGMDVAAAGAPQYTGQRVADFSPLQQLAMQTVRSNVGNWQPNVTAAGNAITAGNTAAGGALSYLNNAAPQQWNATQRDQYMSPYTTGVVDEIARLGNRNFQENIMPGVQSNFIGAGQFGSTRNAEALGRAARDVQADITGRQASALESGYSTAADLFGSDQDRRMQQGATQAQTALNAGQLGVQAGDALGQLGRLQQQLGTGDVSNLFGMGTAVQGQQQQGLDAAYQDFLRQSGWDMNTLGQLRNLVSGVQLPAGATSVSNAPIGQGTSPLGWLQSIINQNAGNRPPAQP